MRVFVTEKCNRRCRSCIKKQMRAMKKVTFEDLKKYDEIIITGGEPMLISERCVEMVHRLRFQGYTGKIYLYTADASKVSKYWAADMLIDEVDGITFTLYYSSKKDKLKNELRSLRKLNKFLKSKDRSGKVDELIIDSRVYTDEYAGTLDGWSKVIPKEMKSVKCEVPEVEECVFYDLEAEG